MLQEISSFFSREMLKREMEKLVIKRDTKITRKVLNKLKSSGAKVEEMPGEDLVLVSGITYGDAAWKVYEEWAELNGDPQVSAVFAPTASIVNSVSSPSEALAGPIQREANSIARHYIPLTSRDFENGAIPVIPAPFDANLPNSRFQNPQLALTKLMQAIQNPQDNYPTLNALKSGSYICTMNQVWANATVEIMLFK